MRDTGRKRRPSPSRSNAKDKKRQHKKSDEQADTRKKQRSTSDWHNASPKTRTERKELRELCIKQGKKEDYCFAGGCLHYPICKSPKASGNKCQIAPEGVAAAKKLALMYRHSPKKEKAQRAERVLKTIARLEKAGAIR